MTLCRYFDCGLVLSLPLCSIGARHFGDEKLSRPSSGQKLAPIEKQSASDSDIKVKVDAC